jgi:hypothetical protein
VTIFGVLPQLVRDLFVKLRSETSGLTVGRRNPRRSEKPFPSSNDLERALIPSFARHHFIHPVEFRHPRTGERFEYDFFHPDLGIAVEIMGYRADDEVYKDIVKFHVHDATRIGVVWVPRWKWVSNASTEANYRAALKALAFAESYMRVEALVALAYDWTVGADNRWTLVHIEGHAAAPPA